MLRKRLTDKRLEKLVGEVTATYKGDSGINFIDAANLPVRGEIVEILPIAQSTTSQHLNVLKKAEIIQGTTEGPATCYCLNESVATTIRASVEALFGGGEKCDADRSE